MPDFEAKVEREDVAPALALSSSLFIDMDKELPASVPNVAEPWQGQEQYDTSRTDVTLGGSAEVDVTGNITSSFAPCGGYSTIPEAGYPHVHYVYHLNLPCDALDYAQVIGRCACNGNMGTAITYYRPRSQSPQPDGDDLFGRFVRVLMAKEPNMCQNILLG